MSRISPVGKTGKWKIILSGKYDVQAIESLTQDWQDTSLLNEDLLRLQNLADCYYEETQPPTFGIKTATRLNKEILARASTIQKNMQAIKSFGKNHE